MANIKSQIKRNRSNERRRLRNQAVRSELKTRTKVAATAMTLGIPVVTQDDDYVELPGLDVIHA